MYGTTQTGKGNTSVKQNLWQSVAFILFSCLERDRGGLVLGME
jgi:hypothetical protein